LNQHDRVVVADRLGYLLCTAATTASVGLRMIVAQLDPLGARFREDISGRRHPVFTGPRDSLGKRVAAAAVPALVSIAAAARAIHARKRLR
jgi:hypothetical protein